MSSAGWLAVPVPRARTGVPCPVCCYGRPVPGTSTREGEDLPGARPGIQSFEVGGVIVGQVPLGGANNRVRRSGPSSISANGTRTACHARSAHRGTANADRRSTARPASSPGQPPNHATNSRRRSPQEVDDRVHQRYTTGLPRANFPACYVTGSQPCQRPSFCPRWWPGKSPRPSG